VEGYGGDMPSPIMDHILSQVSDDLKKKLRAK
jgi:hypothetical protein